MLSKQMKSHVDRGRQVIHSSSTIAGAAHIIGLIDVYFVIPRSKSKFFCPFILTHQLCYFDSSGLLQVLLSQLTSVLSCQGTL